MLYISFFLFFFSGKNESLVFCVGPRLYWCPYAPTGLHSQGWSIRSLQLTSNDCRHHLWHGTMLACPRMHHNITKERVKGPCNYLVKPGSCWLHKSVWKNFSLHAGLEKQLLLGWNSMISSQGCVSTHIHTHAHTQRTDFPTESAPWEVQARAAALTALQRHWFPRFPVCGLSGVSLLSSLSSSRSNANSNGGPNSVCWVRLTRAAKLTHSAVGQHCVQGHA